MNKGMSVTIDLSFCLVLGKGFAASGNNSGCTCGPGGDFPGGDSAVLAMSDNGVDPLHKAGGGCKALA